MLLSFMIMCAVGAILLFALGAFDDCAMLGGVQSIAQPKTTIRSQDRSRSRERPL